MKRRGRLAAPSFFNMDDFRPSTSNAASAAAAAATSTAANSGSSAGSFLHLDTPIRADDVSRVFANEFLSGHESLAGSSTSSASNSFAYSQKNFHTSDGNLYSVFSPLQGQRSRSRPSFLRQHLQQQQHQPQHHQQQTTTSSIRDQSTNQQQQQQQQRWRYQMRQEVSSDTLPGSRHWKNDADKDEDIRHRRFNIFERSSQLADDVETIFNKEKEKFHQRNKRSPSPVRFSSSRWPQDERLDISSLIKSKFGSTSNNTSAESLFQRKEMGVWSEDDDEDDDDDGPLNLCLADRRRRRKSSSSSSKSDLEDHHHHHHHHLRRRRRHQASEEFNENRFSSYSSLFKRDFRFNDDVIRRRQKDEKNLEEEDDTFFNKRVFKDDVTVSQEPTVLDLSMKSTKCPTNPVPTRSVPTATETTHEIDDQKWAPSAIMDTSEWLKSAPENRKHFPRISEMLEKMHLRDDEWRQAMQLDSYRAALESSRERLIHTHPDMFYGWPTDSDIGNKMDVSPQTQKPTETQQQQPQQFFKEQLQPPSQSQHQNTTTSSVKSEDNISLCTLNKPSNVQQQQQIIVQRIEPLRSCSAVTINADIISKSQHQQRQRPLAASSSCPEVPSLNDRSVKQRWTPTKVERPKGRPPRKSSVDSQSNCSSSTASAASLSPFTNDISICKFKLVKGLHPVLEEKKTFHVPLPLRSSPSSSPQRQQTPSSAVEVASGSSAASTADFVQSAFRFNVSPASPTTTVPHQPDITVSPSRSNEPMKTFKFYVDGAGGGGGAGGSGGRKSNVATLPGGGGVISHSRRVRKRSRKTLAREQLEATFREQGFLIKTQQVSSAEGAVYCKFRQLKKFTRYLFKSWKDHLPLDIQGGVEGMPPPNAISAVNTAKVSSTNENQPTV